MTKGDVIAIASLVLLAVAGCDQTKTLLAEDTPEAALKLVEQGAPEACIHPVVTKRLEVMAREENTPVWNAAPPRPRLVRSRRDRAPS